MNRSFRVFFQPEIDSGFVSTSAAPALDRPGPEIPSEQEVIEAVRQAARLEPADPDYYFLLGDALSRGGRHAEAVACHKEALRLHPGNAEAHLGLGQALHALDRREDALASFRTAVHLRPEDVRCLNTLAVALIESGAFREAAALLQNALARDSSQAHLHANLGVALWGLGETTEALRRMKHAARRAPSSAEMQRGLGLACSGTGQPRAALRAYRRAADLRPSDPQPLLDLADELHDQGHLADAEAVYEKALALDPACMAGRVDSQQARQALKLAGLHRELRREVDDRASPVGTVLRFPFAALVAIGQGLRPWRRPRRALYALLGLAGLLAIVLPAAALLPHVVRHYALQDDLASVARSPTADDLVVLDLVRRAIERHGLQGVIEEGRLEVRSYGHWRTIAGEYDVALSAGPRLRHTLHFRLDVAEPFFAPQGTREP